MLHLALQIFSYAEKGLMYVMSSNNKSELHNINIGWFFKTDLVRIVCMHACVCVRARGY